MISWVTLIWSMIASACLTLAAIYFFVWYHDRTEWSPLLFSLTAVSTAAFAFSELRVMRAATPGELAAAMRSVQLTLSIWLVTIVWFVWFYLQAGRRWLAWTVSGMRLWCIVMNFVIWPVDANGRVLRHMQFFGESVTVMGGGGVPQPGVTLFGQFSILLILVFVADASVTAWRRGERRKALMVGGSVDFFLGAAISSSVLVLWAHLQIPVVFSLLYMGLVSVMAYELSRDVIRASQLVEDVQVSEAGLRESEARMTLAVDAGEFGIWIWTLAQHEFWASERWRTLFGFSASTPLHFKEMVQRVHPDDRPALRQTHAAAMAGTSGSRYQAEYRVILPDGRTRWIASQGRVESDAAGKPVLIRGVSRDITARKSAEQETQRLQQELAHAGRVSMLGQLASALAHEINQPLTAILSNAEAADRYLQHPSPDLTEVRAIFADIRSADKRASTVIERMRGLLKRHTVETERVDVGVLVREVVMLVRSDAAARKVTLDVQLPADLPAVRGDRVHLQQVLLNLIINGMDALNGAGPQERRIGVTARIDEARGVEISVRDAGPGISDDALDQLFNPFFTTKADGMGVGLAISRTIIEAHGGRLWAENQDGGGAVFRFTLRTAGYGDKEFTGDQEARSNSFS